SFIESNIFQKKDFFLERFTKFQAKQNKYLAEQQIAQTIPLRLIEVFAIFGLFILISINFFTNGKSVDFITIGAFMAAAYKIIPGIVKILNNIHQIKTYEFTITNLLRTGPVFSPPKGSGNTAIASIEFSEICFAYKAEPILDNFNLSIKQGDFIGIKGMSGKGKTTLLSLLLGFLEPDFGSIVINGHRKEAAARRSHWENISYVQQRTFLINDTVLRNITLQETENDHQKLEEVINLTGLSHLTDESCDSSKKIITEDGKNISGGQRQRIALARALYKKADVLILDEPFNELHKGSENCILKYLQCMARSGKIIILVTHDNESLSFCSKTISLDEN
ncbi:MAG TPA: ABC transporter ATP-binding protein, partial [Chitinophagaceae bacterium]|nr:ABC transporter ATP-binding protein [Chitinophagaceae bacterium]